jgi:uroporphyrinogen decarboxylase
LTQRDAFHAMMEFERPATLCQFEWGYWPEAIERWRGEGLPEGAEPWEDCGITHYFRPPLEIYIYPPFEVEVLEEGEHTRVICNEMGIGLRESKDGLRLPQFIRHPVTCREDFEALQDRLDPTTPGRYPDDWDAWAASAKDFPHLLCLGRRENGFFGWLRELMGLEGLLFAYVEQPDFIHHMCRTHADYLKRLYERALRDVEFDFIFFWEDMAYKNGPLISPAFVEEFMRPYYREMIDYYRQMGARWIVQDSDGDMTQLIPLFHEAGVDATLPCEVAAGMDILALREAFPELRILGGVDKRALIAGPEAIDRELASKLPALFATGGFIPTVDHHVPPEVSYADFQYYLRRCRELYAGQET